MLHHNHWACHLYLWGSLQEPGDPDEVITELGAEDEVLMMMRSPDN